MRTGNHLLRTMSVAIAVAGMVLGGVTIRSASAGTEEPRIVNVSVDSHPPLPDGLKVTCMANGTTLQSGPTCPVIEYRGITTWAYSFVDNRVSLAFVSYDANGKVLRNVTYDGARYVWEITSDAATETVSATGQGNQSVTVPWSQLGP